MSRKPKSSKSLKSLESWEDRIGRIDLRLLLKEVEGSNVEDWQKLSFFRRVVEEGARLADERDAANFEKGVLLRALTDAQRQVESLKKKNKSLKAERARSEKRRKGLSHGGCHCDKYPDASSDRFDDADDIDNSDSVDGGDSDDFDEPDYEEIEARYAKQVAAEEAETWSEEIRAAEDYRQSASSDESPDKLPDDPEPKWLWG